MKLLLIVDRLDRSTLCEPAWWMTDVATHAVSLGWKVEAVTRDPHDQPTALPAGVTRHAHEGGGFDSALARALASRPDVIHVATPGPFGARTIEALAESPVVLDVMTHWPVCPQDDLMWRPAFSRCEVRYPADACGACAGFERLREMESRLRLVSRASAIVVHARFQAERFRGLFGRPVEWVEPGVDTETFRPDPDPPSPGEVKAFWKSRGTRPRVLLVGPPTQARGFGVLVDLIVGVRVRVPEAEFVVVGDDPANPGWSAALHTQLSELGVAEQLRVFPRVEPGDLSGLIASCDVAISPCLWDEPMGSFILQAFACGLPVVAGGRGASTDLVGHGSGMLASPQSPAIFADRVALLLTHAEARHAMGEAARLHAVEHHDLSVSREAIGEILRGAAAGETRRAA
jgi:glycosyltransferase involved in cell wall biosynthesis